jgi:catechol-2,3-dioxygenase
MRCHANGFIGNEPQGISMAMTILLRCHGIEETKSFYADILGFDVSDGEEGTCCAYMAGGTIIFSETDLRNDPPHCTGRFIFFCLMSLTIMQR